MKIDSLRRWIALLGSLGFSLCLLLGGYRQLQAQAVTASADGPAAAVAQPAPVDPLPQGCITGTPAGEDEAVCCISGFVFVGGEPVAGAEIIITAQGKVITATTEIRLGLETRPFYAIDLSHIVSPTVPIKVRARYNGLESATVQHTVQAGGQQRDLLIYNPNVLMLSGGVQEQAEAGRFATPRDVASDAEGNLYIIDQANYRVQVYRAPDGQVLTRPQWQKTLGSGPDQWVEPLGITVDRRSDTVYIADHFNQRVLFYTTDGELLKVWDQQTLGDHFFGAPVDVMADQQGNIYVLAKQIYQYDTAGHLIKQWGPTAGFSAPVQLALAPSGEIYVTNQESPTIYRYSAGNVPVTLPFTTTSHTIPITTAMGIAIDGSNRVYITAQASPQYPYQPRILQVEPDGTLLRQWNYPNPQSGYIDGAYGMTLYGNTLYLADPIRHALARVDTTNELLPPWGSLDDNPARLADPHGLATIPTGPWQDHLLVADPPSGRITLVITDTIRHSWSYRDIGEEATWMPRQLTVDPQGRLWVLDVSHLPDLSRFVLNPATGQLVRAGGPWLTDRAGTVIGIDLAVDSVGRIYLADPFYNRVVVYQEATATTLTLLAELTSVAPQTPDYLRYPEGIAIDEADPQYPNGVVVYVADTANQRILKLLFANTQFTYLAAWQNLLVEPDCQLGAFPTLAQPSGLAVDPAHNLYVADRNNQRILKLNGQSGRCLISFTSYFGSRRLAQPEALALDSQGRLYVSEPNLGRVQHFRAMVVSAPVATIVHLSSVEVRPGDLLTAIGAGADGDATNQISNYQWRSTTGLSLTTSTPTIQIPTSVTTTTASALGPGLHRLQLRVQDNEGEWSATIAVALLVEPRAAEAPPVIPPLPDTTKAPPAPPANCRAGALWTFLLYLDADYNDQGRLFSAYQQTIADLANVVHPCFQFFLQVDGRASATKRWIKRYDAPLTEVTSFQAEVQMDAAAALGEFIAAGQQQLPADHYYLAIANHGDGVRGIAWDHTTAADDSAYLTLAEIRQALEQPGVLPVDILHLDACSMALLDGAYQLRAKVTYLIAAQYVGWDFFAYGDYARYAGDFPRPDLLARQIINRYAALAESYALPYTLAAIDLQRIEPLKNGFDALTLLLKAWLNNDATGARHQALLTARNNSQFFDSNTSFTNSTLDSYVDLYDWLVQLRAAPVGPEIIAKANQLLTELERSDGVILHNRRQSNPLPLAYAGGALIDLSRAHGLSIFYPLESEPQQAASATATGPYTQLYVDYLAQTRFDLTRVTRWDEFLQSAYGTPTLGTPLEPPLPPPAPLTAPRRAFYLPLVRQ